VGAAAKALPRAPRARRADLAPAGVFKKEVSDMMYAFGDAEEPLAATVAVVEEIVRRRCRLPLLPNNAHCSACQSSRYSWWCSSPHLAAVADPPALPT